MKCGLLRVLFGIRKDGPIREMQARAARDFREAMEDHSRATGAVVAAATAAHAAILAAKEGKDAPRPS